MNIIVLLNVTPEDNDNLRMVLDRTLSYDDTVVLTAEEIKKQKRSEYDKQRYQDKKNSNVKNVENDVKSCEKCENDVKNVEFHKEEREEERSVSPLDSPLPFPPNTPNPITPLIPSSQKEEEGEENVLATVPKAKRDRGELKHFGAFVQLSNAECQKLVDQFGKDKVFQMIDNMNNYIGEDPKRIRTYKTRNHYLTLLNWERMDQDRKQPKQIPKEKTFHDIAVERGLVEPSPSSDFVDSFWRN